MPLGGSGYGWQGPIATTPEEARALVASAMGGSGVGLGSPTTAATPVSTSTYGPIGANLPWGAGAGANPMDYAGQYRESLAMNRQNYENLMSGFSQVQAAQQAAQNNVQAGYTNLRNEVLADINTLGASRAQDINTASVQNQADALQSLISRGLGNTTVSTSVQSGLEADRQRSLNSLFEQIGGMRANYASSLGLAGLNFAGNAIGANTNLGLQQLGAIERVNAGYPSAELYARLLAQQGMAAQAGRDRAAVMGGASMPSMGLTRMPGTGGGLPPPSGSFAPGYDVGAYGNLGGYGLGGAFAGTAAYIPVRPDIAGYGKSDTGALVPSFGPSAHDAFNPAAGYGAAQEADYGYNPGYYGGAGGDFGYGAAAQAEATGYPAATPELGIDLSNIYGF